MNGTNSSIFFDTRGTRRTLRGAVYRSGTSLARKQSLARFDALTSLGNTGKDNQRPKRKLTDQSAVIGENRVSEKGRVMFGRKKHASQEQLVQKTNRKLDRAAKKAVKDAKKTQEIIIANGFTLELLLAMGGKD